MYPKFGIPQTKTKAEKERIAQAHKREQTIADERHEAYLRNLNRINGVGERR